MDRCHFENSFAMGCLEIADLDHNRKYFYQIDQSDQQNEQRHLKHISSSCHKSAKSQRSCISHKYLCRIYIKQKKSHKSAYYRTGDRFNATFGTDRYHCKKYCHDQRNTGCQSVQSICKVYTVYRSDHYKKHNRDRQPAKIQIMIR